jgi:hypothetical protein
MPQNVIANQRINGTYGCTILIGWLPPANLSEDDISHYVININNGTSINETLTLTAHPVCECATTYRVNVSAIDRCGREGQGSVVVLDQDPTLLPSSDLQCSAPTGTIKFIVPSVPCQNNEIGNINKTHGLSMCVSVCVYCT